MENKKLIIGELKGKHFFDVLDITDKMGMDAEKLADSMFAMQEKVSAATDKDGKVDEAVSIAAAKDYMMVAYKEVWKKIPKVKDEIRKLIADLSEKSVEEVEESSMEDYREAIKSIVTDAGFMALFK